MITVNQYLSLRVSLTIAKMAERIGKCLLINKLRILFHKYTFHIRIKTKCSFFSKSLKVEMG